MNGNQLSKNARLSSMGLLFMLGACTGIGEDAGTLGQRWAAGDLELSTEMQVSVEQRHVWTIDKSGDASEISLEAGQTGTVNYSVLAAVNADLETVWKVAGTITVTNPAAVEATVTGVTDVIDGEFSATVDCGVEFPHTLAAGETLSCSYEVLLPDGATRTNVVDVTISGEVGPASASATVDFTDVPVEVVDDCATVDDSLAGSLGTLCVDEAPKTFEYPLDIGPYECGPAQNVDNTVTLTTDDTGTTVSDDWRVTVTIPSCDGEVGCTLTPGYWKNHSSYGPAPYDETWASFPGAEDGIFFQSGATNLAVMRTAPEGNAYYILARAYVAAVLNGLAGADTSAVQAELDAAAALFAAYTPAQIAALKGSAAVRQEFISIAGTLDEYNNGLIGPVHCSD